MTIITSQDINKQGLTTDAVEREEVAQALEEAAEEIRAAKDATTVYDRVGDALTRLAKANQKAATEADMAERNARTAIGNLRRTPSPFEEWKRERGASAAAAVNGTGRSVTS